MEPYDRSAWPLWVRIGMAGLSSRRAVWAFVWLSVACAAACLVYGLTDRRFFIGVPAMALAALAYVRTIHWLDKHGAWPPGA